MWVQNMSIFLSCTHSTRNPSLQKTTLITKQGWAYLLWMAVIHLPQLPVVLLTHIAHDQGSYCEINFPSPPLLRPQCGSKTIILKTLTCSHTASNSTGPLSSQNM